MTDDLISRIAATTIPVMPKEHRHYQTNNLDDAYEQGWDDLQECIKNIPSAQSTADVVEVVRCKDCKRHEWCSIEEMAMINDEIFFCKYGERKEDEH